MFKGSLLGVEGRAGSTGEPSLDGRVFDLLSRREHPQGARPASAWRANRPRAWCRTGRGRLTSAADRRPPRRQREGARSRGRAFRLKIVYKSLVQTAAAWFRSLPHRNHGCRIATRRAARGYRAGHSGAIAAHELGDKPKLTEDQRREATRRRDTGEFIRSMARSYNVNSSTISRLTSERDYVS